MQHWAQDDKEIPVLSSKEGGVERFSAHSFAEAFSPVPFKDSRGAGGSPLQDLSESSCIIEKDFRQSPGTPSRLLEQEWACWLDCVQGMRRQGRHHTLAAL